MEDKRHLPPIPTVVSALVVALVAGIITWQFTRQSGLKDYWDQQQDLRLQAQGDAIKQLQVGQTGQNTALEDARARSVELVTQINKRIASLEVSVERRSTDIYTLLEERIGRVALRVQEGDQKNHESISLLVNRFLGHSHNGMPIGPGSGGDSGAHPREQHLLPDGGDEDASRDREIGFADWGGRVLRPYGDRDPSTGLRRVEVSIVEPWWVSH